MEQISAKDRAILREIAARHEDYAHDAKNEAILKKWHAQEMGIREMPTVRLLFSNFRHGLGKNIHARTRRHVVT